MYSAGISRHNAACKVCFDAGQLHLCNTHKTKGDFSPQEQAAVIQGGWPINKQIGKITLCPVLQNTVCTNPQCFNGQNGKIRFPFFGHSISHCPCQWPQGWEIGGNLEHMRYTGYTQEQWRQIEYNNQLMQQQQMIQQQHMMQQHMIQQHMMQQQHMMKQPMMEEVQLTKEKTSEGTQSSCQRNDGESSNEKHSQEQIFPQPSPLVRQTACTPQTSPQLSSLEELPPHPPPLVRKNAQDGNSSQERAISPDYPAALEQQLTVEQREKQLKKEVEILRKKLAEKIEREKEKAIAEVEKNKNPNKMSWADMCESDYEDEEEESDIPYDTESDSEFAKVAPSTYDEEEEKQKWKTVSHKKKNKEHKTFQLLRTVA